MLSTPLVVGTSFAYLLLLVAVAAFGDARARQRRSVIGNAWVYALSMAVYCTAWTYFGSVGRAAGSGVWFLPIYLGPTLAMVLAWTVLRKMIRIAKAYRITSIADFIGSRYGKSPLLAGTVTLITVVGIVPYIALQLKAVASGYALLTTPLGTPLAGPQTWWHDSTFYFALALAGFTVVFGARHLDSSERHEGMVAAMAFESIVKLAAFLAVGVFVTWGLFDGPGDLFGRALAVPELHRLLGLTQAVGQKFAYEQWFALTLLSMLSVFFLPRQFQMMVVENVEERHVKRAAWLFPLYLLLINLFVLPIALGGLLHFGPGRMDADSFVLSLPLSVDQSVLALFVFIGGLSAATGMVIVEATAVSMMVCNDLVMPMLLRLARVRERTGGDLSRLLLSIRASAIVVILLFGYAYFAIAGEAYALVSIGLISFAAVAQFAPAMLAGLYWKGGTRHGALAGLVFGFALWAWTLMLPSVAKSGWLAAGFLHDGPWGITLLKPEQFLGLAGLDNLTHALFWSLLANVAAFVAVSLALPPSAREASQAHLFVDVMFVDVPQARASTGGPVFWRGRAQVAELLPLASRFLGTARAMQLFTDYARQRGVATVEQIPADAALVQFVETQLAGAIGSASARVMVATVVEEEPLGLDDVMRILDEASQLRAYSRELESATAELRAANEQLHSLDRLKDDFMSSVTHELRTPLTSIRALSEMMADDLDMPAEQRAQFLQIITAETERLSRLVNQVLDMAKIESGHAQWATTDVDLREVLLHAVQTTAEMFRERGALVATELPERVPTLPLDADRMTQVVLNLLSNAAKFLPAEGGRVIVRLQERASGLRVEIEDNGSGVAAQQQAVIFERFRQGGDAANRPQGTGLGLPISRQIVEHFGGTLAVRSAPGAGACFSFELPWPAAAESDRTDKTGDTR